MKTESEKFRVEDKQNVFRNGRRTLFKLFESRPGAYVFVGLFSAPGWNASDNKCIAAWRKIERDADYDAAAIAGRP